MRRVAHKKSRSPGQTLPPPTLRQQLILPRPIAELQLNDCNPRVHSPRQIRQIAESIKTFGFAGAVLIDREGRAIAGHARILACQQLGWTEVPTICLDHLSPDQARAFMIADNRLSEISSWNDQLLAETLRDLSLADLDFSLEVTGFEMAEIDLRIESLGAAPRREDDPADTPATLPTGPAVSRPGDLWTLGRHRLLCGNALDEAAYARLMAGKRAAMMFTDPPYNVPIAGHVSGLGAVQHREFAMASGEMSAPQFTTFLRSALDPAARHSRDGALHFICMDWRHMTELLAAGRSSPSSVSSGNPRCRCIARSRPSPSRGRRSIAGASSSKPAGRRRWPTSRSRPHRVWNRIPDEVRGCMVDLELAEPELSPRKRRCSSLMPSDTSARKPRSTAHSRRMTLSPVRPSSWSRRQTSSTQIPPRRTSSG
jgi:hypothetical protein